MNYFNVKVTGEAVNQENVSKLFNEIKETNRIREFHFYDKYVEIESRGLPEYYKEFPNIFKGCHCTVTDMQNIIEEEDGNFTYMKDEYDF